MKIPSARSAFRWFDPRYRKMGSWAFALNRLTALALTFYLALHLVVLHKLTQGPQAYDDFVAFAQSPWIKTGEVILIAAVVLHGLNGLRLALLAFGLWVRQQKFLFALVLIATAFVSFLFAIRLFIG